MGLDPARGTRRRLRLGGGQGDVGQPFLFSAAFMALAWLVVTRNTISHEITAVELARDVARSEGRSK